MNKKFLFLIIASVIIFSWIRPVQAGFGIAPPYVKSDQALMPGSHYEQTIMLLRSSAEDDLQAQITINAPEMQSWIKIDKGDTFDLPKGELQVPMRAVVDVPKNADIGNYKGYINVRIAPKGEQASGVSIALGARVDIDLNVSNDTVADFTVRTALIPDFETLRSPWNWPIFSWLFHRIRLVMKIENSGNIPAAPSKVHLDVYDLSEQKLLEASDDKSIKKVPPFQTEDVSASFPTKLSAGQYWGRIKIYKDNEIVRSDKMAFTISGPGTLAVGQPKLGPWPYVVMGIYILIVLVIILLLVKFKFWRWLWSAGLFVAWPFRWLGRKLGAVGRGLNYKFWRWLHRKSAKYQAEEPVDKNQNKD